MVAGAGVVLAGLSIAWVQPEAQPGEAQGKGPSPQEHTLQSAFRLGDRVSSIRAQVPLLSTVVIVPDDARSYIEAVARWNPKLRYPVLIDDGSLRAAEDIARFVHAFNPTSVVRWELSPDVKSSEGEPAPLPGGVPEHHPKELAALVDRAVCRAWGFDSPTLDPAGFVAHLKGMNLTPPGVVLCNPEDTAWTAGLALAAGHGQTIAWLKAPQSAGGTMNIKQAEAVVTAADNAAKATGLKYDGLGDDIDSVALCMNVPAKFPKGEGQKMMMASTTDVVGRRNFAVAGDTAQRWGWSSVVWGTRPRAAYSAMCSLFLTPSKAWVFDGYGDDGAFKAYDGTKAGELLGKVPGLTVEVDDKPSQDANAWRSRTQRPIDASLILVNSKGNADFFDVNPGRLKPADVPLLNVPAAVHFVHSWSAADVSAGGTVAGRWFNHGVFAYLGSVEEPFLQAFVPTPVIAARLGGKLPWAAATRVEGGPIWKIACFGDPLWTLTPPGPRREAGEEIKLPLEGAKPATEALRDELKAGNYAAAVKNLAFLGRDGDVARLTDSTLKEKPSAVDSDFVSAALPSLFRAGRSDLVIECYSRLDNQPSADEYLRDVLWHACEGTIDAAPTPVMVGLLSRNIRIDNRERDEAIVNKAKAKLPK